jgi:hypothetical protein
MEDAGGEAEHDRSAQERAADHDQPAGPGIATAQARQDEQGKAGDDGEPEQPSGLISQRRLEQAERAGGAAE